ncbi:MAG: DUF3301 domain-containing protein [Xanthomonadales bacterium]|nr:DUF3301 domain-containing protein [Xanthomonadales bacterium]
MSDAAPLIALIVFGIGFWWWQSVRGAYDRARELGRNACNAAQVQWLDESVQNTGMRLRRDPGDGWLKLERRFRFEYSTDGHDRRAGHLVLLGTRLTEFAGPTRPEPVVAADFGESLH